MRAMHRHPRRVRAAVRPWVQVLHQVPVRQRVVRGVELRVAAGLAEAAGAAGDQVEEASVGEHGGRLVSGARNMNAIWPNLYPTFMKS